MDTPNSERYGEPPPKPPRSRWRWIRYAAAFALAGVIVAAAMFARGSRRPYVFSAEAIVPAQIMCRGPYVTTSLFITLENKGGAPANDLKVLPELEINVNKKQVRQDEKDLCDLNLGVYRKMVRELPRGHRPGVTLAPDKKLKHRWVVPSNPPIKGPDGTTNAYLFGCISYTDAADQVHQTRFNWLFQERKDHSSILKYNNKCHFTGVFTKAGFGNSAD